MIVVNIASLQIEFHIALEKAIDKQYLIENELREINNYLNYSATPKQKRKGFFGLGYPSKETQIFKIYVPNLLRSFFVEAFNSYLINGSFQLEINSQDTEESQKIKSEVSDQAYAFAEYYKWLNEIKSLPQKVKKRTGLSHKQKLLALHYMGLDTSKFDNTAVAKILSEVLDLSEDNTRQYLSYLSAGRNNVRTKANLEKINQLFEEQGLTEISWKIKSDIEKI